MADDKNLAELDNGNLCRKSLKQNVFQEATILEAVQVP